MTGPLLCALALLSFLAPAAPAQTEKAVLLRGPRVGRGIDIFGPNALPYERVEYSYRGGEVTVFHIRSYQPPPKGWVRGDCGKVPLLRPAPGSTPGDVPGAAPGRPPDGRVFLHDGGEDWSLLFLFGEGVERPCPFIEAFLPGFRNFLRLAVSPFPAWVEVK